MIRYCWLKKDLKNLENKLEKLPFPIQKSWEITDKGKIDYTLKLEGKNLYATLDKYSAIVDFYSLGEGKKTGEISKEEKQLLEIITKEYKMPISIEHVLFALFIAGVISYLSLALHYLKYHPK